MRSFSSPATARRDCYVRNELHERYDRNRRVRSVGSRNSERISARRPCTLFPSRVGVRRAGAHVSRARDARRPSRSRASRRAVVMVRLPPPKRVVARSPRAHRETRRRCPPIAAAAVRRPFSIRDRVGAAEAPVGADRRAIEARDAFRSGDEARADWTVRASTRPRSARGSARALTFVFPSDRFRCRARSRPCFSSRFFFSPQADREPEPRQALRRAGQDVHRRGVRRAVLRVRDRAR